MNRYGVDSDYFTKKLLLVIRDIENYTPAELTNELINLTGAVRPMDECLNVKIGANKA